MNHINVRNKGCNKTKLLLPKAHLMPAESSAELQRFDSNTHIITVPNACP